MKNTLLWLVTFGALCAQDIAGTWQGAVSLNGEERRMVIKIGGENGAWNATLYNIDANPRPVPASAVTLQGGMLNITFLPGRLVYEGRVNGDSIAGSIQQGPNALTLNLGRASAATAWAIPEPPPPPTAMAANARLAFEVATIKPASPDAQNKPFRVSQGRIEILNRSLVELMGEAWGIHVSQVAGASGWMQSQRWDIVGQPAAPGQPNQGQVREIVRSLLAERFGLKQHVEQRELSVYAIRSGPEGQHKLRPTVIQSNLPLGDIQGAGVFNGRNTRIEDLAEILQGAVLDRPVVDQTGIAGRFDFLLQWRPDEFQFGGRAASMQKPPNADELPDLFRAFEEQLGLRLEAVKAPASVYVIDSAERPSEN